MTKAPESVTGASRSFTVNFSDTEASDRAEIEQFIKDVFFQVCGAKVKFFLPTLISLRDLDGKLVAACGIRNAGSERLFMENYLDQPIEEVLSARVGRKIERKDIVEIGNYSVAEMGMSRQLSSVIFDQLHRTSKQWAVFTAVQLVHNALLKLGITPEVLGEASIDRLPPEDRSDWGNYYEQNPQVMAIERVDRRARARTT